MKVLFSLLSVCAFSFASAQSNDLFDVNQHLKKINEKSKVESEKQIIRNPFSINIDTSFYLPNGDKVVTLQGYNMPCVVPDMSQFQSMPVAGKSFVLKRNEYGAIPNPSNPIQIEELISKVKIKIIK